MLAHHLQGWGAPQSHAPKQLMSELDTPDTVQCLLLDDLLLVRAEQDDAEWMQARPLLLLLQPSFLISSCPPPALCTTVYGNFLPLALQCVGFLASSSHHSLKTNNLVSSRHASAAEPTDERGLDEVELL